MKRNLRQSQNVSEMDLNTDQKNQLHKLKNMAKQYEGKSENEIFNDLSSAIKRGKADGSLTDEKINNLASTISPMLNPQQKSKLSQLMKMIKNQ